MPTLKYVDIDDWNRPIFKDELDNYYGALNVLFSYGASEQEVLQKINKKDLTHFGNHFNCEPYGDSIKGDVIIERLHENLEGD